MSNLVWMGLGNLALAIPLAAIAWLSGRLANRPALTHGLWALVLLKLVTPPVGIVPIDFGFGRESGVGVEEKAIAPDAETPLLPNGAPVIEVAGDIPNGDLGEISEPGPSADINETDAIDFQPLQAIANAPMAPVVVEAETTPVPSQNLVIAWPLDTVVNGSMLAFGGLWLSGAAFVWLRIAINAWRFEKLLRNAPSISGPLHERVAQLAKQIGVRCPDIAYVPGTLSPLLWVWGRCGTLVLPGDFFESLDADKQDTLIVHELAHWRRGDHWVRRLECLAGGLYWWCPLVAVAQRGLRQAEEELCDAWVVATIPDSARVYALALVETVDFLAGARPMLPPLASGLGPFPSLQRRLTMIFRTGTPRRLSTWGLLGLALLGGLLLSWSPAPSNAQDDPNRPRKDGERKKEGERQDGQREGGGFFGKKEFKRDPKKEPRGEDLAPPERDPRPREQILDQELRELEALRQELRARQAELEVKNRLLEDKIRALKDRARADFERPVPPMPPPTPGGPGRPGGDVNQRIDVLEQKLEVILRELTSLRREMGERGRGPFPPTIPGPGGPPRGEDAPPPTQPRKVGPGRPGFGVEFEFTIPTPATPPAPPVQPLPPRGQPRSSDRRGTPEVIPVAPRRVDLQTM